MLLFIIMNSGPCTELMPIVVSVCQGQTSHLIKNIGILLSGLKMSGVFLKRLRWSEILFKGQNSKRNFISRIKK